MFDAASPAVILDDEATFETERVSDVEDLTVHVAIDSSLWHKKAVGGHETACGLTINYRLAIGLRQESYDGELCEECFSEHERLVLAPKHHEQRRLESERRLELELAEQRAFFDRLRSERKPPPKK